MKKRFVSALLILIVMVTVTFSAHAAGLLDFLKPQETVTISVDEYNRLKKYEKLDTVLQYVQNWYYQKPDDKKMMEGAIQGLLYSLEDPYSFYYSPEDWTTMWEDDEGEYAGIGLNLLGSYVDYTVTVIRVFRDTPAQQAGVRKGDLLVRVEDIEVDAYSMQDAVDVMRGKVGEEVEIEVLRDGEYLTFTMPRALIHVNRVESCMLENDVGYIALYEFAGECQKEFTAELEKLQQQGAKSLVVDLRDNPGGWVDGAVEIADLFMDKGELAYSMDRYNTKESMNTRDGKTDIPVVFLVNENSASASEILAGGLQDQGLATLVGVKTFGKGIIQSVIPLDGMNIETSEDGFQMTIAQYYFPSGKAIHKIGIEPDVVVEMPEEMKNQMFELGDMTDPQLKAAWEEAVKKIPQ
ncbi:MAG: S41 family peptidase [Clostridia bacterium]|nr:S41 family peptidase [Clostridia bacterium]MBR6809722.1 S41 family peptidase [Clostridia bacterium]